MNNLKDYRYLITSSTIDSISGNYLYFKTNEEPQTELDGIDLSVLKDASTWYRFIGTQEVNGNIEEIKQSEDYLFIRYTNGNLDVYNNELETNYRAFNIDNENCHFIEIVEEIGILLIDRGGSIDVRRLIDFFPLASLKKPDGYTDYISFIVKNKRGEYLLIDESNNGYIIVGLTTSTPSIPKEPKLLSSSTIVCGYNKTDNSMVLFSNSGNDIIETSLIVTDGYFINSFDSVFKTGTILLDSISFFEKIVLLADNGKMYIYDVNNSTTSIINIYDVGTGFTNIFLLDKINLYRNLTPGTTQKIIGFNSGANSIRKTHYFNATVTSSVETNIFLKDEESIINLINTLKPIHTQLRTLTLLFDYGVFGAGNFGVGVFGVGEIT